MIIVSACGDDAQDLACLRDRAMRESLEAAGRYDPVRVKQRFLSTFEPSNTHKLLVDGALAGFYVVLDKGDHLYLDHLYIDPGYQGKGLGAKVLKAVKDQARVKSVSIRLGALKGSSANEFYQAHGFVQTHEGAFDFYYEFFDAKGHGA